MPQLPTLNLTQAQFDRCLAVFGDAPTYKAWLTGVLRQEIIRAEVAALVPRQTAERRAVIDEINNVVLPAPPPVEPT